MQTKYRDPLLYGSPTLVGRLIVKYLPNNCLCNQKTLSKVIYVKYVSHLNFWFYILEDI